MNERRRIIISTGADSDEPLVSPQFDSEATSHARPVVPLADQETFQMPYGAYQRKASKPVWKRPAMLALIVVIAVGAGVATGIAISLYRNRQATKPQETAPTVSAGESATTDAVAEQSPSPKSPVVAPVVPPESSAKSEAEDRETTTGKQPSDNAEVSPPVVRDNTPVKPDDDADRVADAREEERERRREERRERRRRQREQDEPLDVPRPVDRAGRALNRIREIFEGRQP